MRLFLNLELDFSQTRMGRVRLYQAETRLERSLDEMDYYLMCNMDITLRSTVSTHLDKNSISS